MKALEDHINKLTGTNAALTDTVRALQKENAHARQHADEDRGSPEADSDEDDPPVLFSARKVNTLGFYCTSVCSADSFEQVTVTNRSNPDMVRQKKHRVQGDIG